MNSRRGRRLALGDGFRFLALLSSFTLQAYPQGRDTAYYPRAGRPASESPAPPLVFEKLCELTAPGLPAGDPLPEDPEGRSALFRTTEGSFRMETGACERREAVPAARAEDTLAGASALQDRLEARSWRGRLVGTPLDGIDVGGPDGIVAILARDGTLYGRLARNGHLLWRRRASHRISRAGASIGAYLIVAPDASRSLEAYRWSDGTPAGVFLLGAEESMFASAPLAVRDRIFILATTPPRREARMLAIVPRASSAVTTGVSGVSGRN